jgi:hypothetical protein
VDLHSRSIGFLKVALNSAKIRGELKRLSLLGRRGTGKQLPGVKIRDLAIAARPKSKK